MKTKLLLIVLNIFLVCNFAFAILEGKVDEIDPPTLRGSRYVSVPQGAFLKAILQENISTETNLQYDTIRAIIPTNFYMMNYICIPKSSIVEGEISKLELPKKGRHGLFKVKFYKIVTPKGKVIPLNASLWMQGSTQIGGGPSQMAEVRVVPHRVEGLNNFGTLSMRRSGEYTKGQNVSVKAGVEIIIKLDEKLNIKL